MPTGTNDELFRTVSLKTSLLMRIRRQRIVSLRHCRKLTSIQFDVVHFHQANQSPGFPLAHGRLLAMTPSSRFWAARESRTNPRTGDGARLKVLEARRQSAAWVADFYSVG